MPSILTPAQRKAFNQDGFVLVRSLFDDMETALLKEAIEIDPQVQTHLFDIVDPRSGCTKMALWNHPGDGLFFHCKTLHSSEPKHSPQSCWTLLCCYNATRNNPYLEHHHPFYTPLGKGSDSAIRRTGLKLAAGESESFLRQSSDPAQLQRENG